MTTSGSEENECTTISLSAPAPAELDPLGGLRSSLDADLDGNGNGNDKGEGNGSLHSLAGSSRLSAENSAILAVDNEMPIAPRMFTPRLPRFEEHGWVAPSKRLRSLDGVKRFTIKGEKKFGHLEKTYGKRQFRKEDDERKMAVSLLGYLRLQPYTGRPCLGLVHMARRIEYAGK